ncbi:MAG: PA2779 family protein [Gammaproteobacteria bacterium]|nr:PA2779 family protein [Gammaproteobacteria bacterium]MCZ6762506.1 PA2779 family protein [Gammaproteobacteria bacterium]
MHNPIFVKPLIFALIAGLLCLGFPQGSMAGMIGTDSLIAAQERQGQIDRINDVLAKDNVRHQLIRFGVNPADAEARVASLSNSELLNLEISLNGLDKAGAGLVEVFGIVFIVILILELLNVTNLVHGI